MSANDLDRHMPDFVRQVPDVRTCEPRDEICRCARVLGWLDQQRASDLVRPRPPAKTADLVSVVVPMYNASPWIDMCLKGLFTQTHSNLEIFCVDDCSEDDTYDRVVDQFGRDGRVCVVRLARNVGPFQISNWVAGSLARGRMVAWQDADNVSHPARIEEQCRWMLSHRYRISGTCVHHFFPSHIAPFHLHTKPVEADGMLHELVVYLSKERTQESAETGGASSHEDLAWLRNDTALSHAGGSSARPLAFNYLAKSLSSHGSQIVERDLLREFGGFQGRTKFGEDSEFDWRLSRFHSIGNIPKVLCSRRSHSDSLTRHPSTGMGSPGRRQYRESMNATRETIEQELISGNIVRARELCTESLYCADIKIERAHAGFDVGLSR